MKGRSAARFCAGALAMLGVVACGGDDVALEERPEIQGYAPADVADLIARDDTAYSSTDEQLRSLQQFAKGWAACRDVYNIYDDLVRTGELAPKPEPRSAEAEISGTSEEIQQWIDSLYAPLLEGDPATARSTLADEQTCGFIPVEEVGDRSVTIADALNDSAE